MRSAAPIAPSAIHRSFLGWKNGLYAKVGLGASALAAALYWMHQPDGPPNGGTLLGYTYGTVGAALIVWLAWFGIRRRRYGVPMGLDGLLSAHVYLGLSLVVVATLHTGFRFHWNVHTLSYVLMVAVIASGTFGAFAFWHYPPQMTANRAGASLEAMTAELAAFDSRCRELAPMFPDDIKGLVISAIDDAKLRRSGWTRIWRGADPCRVATLTALNRIREEVGRPKGSTAAEIVVVSQTLTRRLAVVEKLRRDRAYRARLLLWRAVHVPLTVALLAALAIHIVAVFFYR